ncbi:MAG TPA: YraN family protein [Longimicrobiales bacterium]|nr:YraN family protein [Longimicrobiales bacterium]
MARTHELGRDGEALAARYLEDRGWRILARNFRSGHKEIDLVARRGHTVAFVEVKTRSGGRWGHPLEAVNALKRREIERVALRWMQLRGRDGDLYRFDAVAIHWRAGEAPRVEHVEDAWRL